MRKNIGESTSILSDTVHCTSADVEDKRGATNPATCRDCRRPQRGLAGE